MLPVGVWILKCTLLRVFVSVVLRRKISVVESVVLLFSWWLLMLGGVLSWMRRLLRVVFLFPSASIAVMFHVNVVSGLIVSWLRVTVPVVGSIVCWILLSVRYACWMLLLSINCA